MLMVVAHTLGDNCNSTKLEDMDNFKAILISVSYNNLGQQELPFCINDSNELKNALQIGLKFKENNIECLGVDGFVNKDTFLYKMNEFCSSLRKDDNVIFYFTGHGGIIDNVHKLLMTDSLIKTDYIISILGKSNAKSVILILDCCNAGGVKYQRQFELSLNDTISKFYGKGYAIFASSLSNQSSFKHPEENISLFTYFLSNAMMNKYSIRKGYKTIHDIKKQVKQYFEVWSINNNKTQYPIFLSNLGGTIRFKVEEYSPYQIGKYKNETDEYIITEVEPLHVSHLKRYSLKVILKEVLSIKKIGIISENILNKVRKLEIYSNLQSEQYFYGKQLDVCFIYFAMDEIDLDGNFMCRATWVQNESDRTHWYKLYKNDIILNDFHFNFSSYYNSLKIFINLHTDNEFIIISSIKSIRTKIINAFEQVLSQFELFRANLFDEPQFITIIKNEISLIDDLYQKSTNLNFAPQEIRNWDEAHQDLFATIHNITLYWGINSKNTWPIENRIYLTQRAESDYQECLKNIQIIEKSQHPELK